MNCTEVTKEQLKTTNGCGSSAWFAWPFRIPRWISKAFFRCCNRHDIRYQVGTTIANKWFADDELLDCMYYNAFHSPWWQRCIKIKVADLVYWCLGTTISKWCFKKAGRK